MTRRGPRITTENTYREMSDFANNNPSFKRQLVDEYDVSMTSYDNLGNDDSYYDDDYLRDMVTVTRDFRAWRNDRNAPPGFAGSVSAMMTSSYLPEYIKLQLEDRREELIEEGCDLDGPDFMRETWFDYKLYGEDADDFESNMGVRVYTRSFDRELLISSYDRTPDNDCDYTRGTTMTDESRDIGAKPQSVLIQSYDSQNTQRLKNEPIFRASDSLDNLDDLTLRILGLPGSEMDHDIQRRVDYENLRMATFAFRSLRAAIRRQAGIID